MVLCQQTYDVPIGAAARPQQQPGAGRPGRPGRHALRDRPARPAAGPPGRHLQQHLVQQLLGPLVRAPPPPVAELPRGPPRRAGARCCSTGPSGPTTCPGPAAEPSFRGSGPVGRRPEHRGGRLAERGRRGGAHRGGGHPLAVACRAGRPGTTLTQGLADGHRHPRARRRRARTAPTPCSSCRAATRGPSSSPPARRRAGARHLGLRRRRRPRHPLPQRSAPGLLRQPAAAPPGRRGRCGCSSPDEPAVGLQLSHAPMTAVVRLDGDVSNEPSSQLDHARLPDPARPRDRGGVGLRHRQLVRPAGRAGTASIRHPGDRAAGRRPGVALAHPQLRHEPADHRPRAGTSRSASRWRSSARSSPATRSGRRCRCSSTRAPRSTGATTAASSPSSGPTSPTGTRPRSPTPPGISAFGHAGGAGGDLQQRAGARLRLVLQPAVDVHAGRGDQQPAADPALLPDPGRAAARSTTRCGTTTPSPSEPPLHFPAEQRAAVLRRHPRPLRAASASSPRASPRSSPSCTSPSAPRSRAQTSGGTVTTTLDLSRLTAEERVQLSGMGLRLNRVQPAHRRPPPSTAPPTRPSRADTVILPPTRNASLSVVAQTGDPAPPAGPRLTYLSKARRGPDRDRGLAAGHAGQPRAVHPLLHGAARPPHRAGRRPLRAGRGRRPRPAARSTTARSPPRSRPGPSAAPANAGVHRRRPAAGRDQHRRRRGQRRGGARGRLGPPDLPGDAAAACP